MYFCFPASPNLPGTLSYRFTGTRKLPQVLAPFTLLEAVRHGRPKSKASGLELYDLGPRLDFWSLLISKNRGYEGACFIGLWLGFKEMICIKPDLSTWPMAGA